jgi:AcrR family transcriptional regulator
MMGEGGPRGPGRPARLSADAIVAAAVEHRTGQLTVRGLARRLGVAHSALYRWVGDRDGLLDLVSDSLLDRVSSQITDEPAGDWRRWLTNLGHALRREFLPVADAEVLAKFPRTTPVYDRLQQRAETEMIKDGLSAVQASESFTVFLFTVWGWIAAEKACGEGPSHDSHFTAMLTALTRGLPAAPDQQPPDTPIPRS